MKSNKESKRLTMQISGRKAKLGFCENIYQNMYKNEDPNEYRDCSQRQLNVPYNQQYIKSFYE